MISMCKDFLVGTGCRRLLKAWNDFDGVREIVHVLHRYAARSDRHEKQNIRYFMESAMQPLVFWKWGNHTTNFNALQNCR
jgi:hypothetical protein